MPTAWSSLAAGMLDDVREPRAYHPYVRQQVYNLSVAGKSVPEIMSEMRPKHPQLAKRTVLRWRAQFHKNVAGGLHPVTGRSGSTKDPLPPDAWKELVDMLTEEPRLYLHEMSERLQRDAVGEVCLTVFRSLAHSVSLSL